MKLFKKNKRFLISISILLVSQAFFYWFIKLFQHNPHYISYHMDGKIPFIPQFIYTYNLFYPFMFVAFYYLFEKDKKTYYKGLIAGIIGFLMCDTIYLYYPTVMIRPPIPNNIDFLTSLVVKITYFFDEPPLNCFPSIHCLFCFQIIFSYIKTKLLSKKQKIIGISVALLIIISTVLVKQHYLLDILSALLICIIANIISDITDLSTKLKEKIEAKFS